MAKFKLQNDFTASKVNYAGGFGIASGSMVKRNFKEGEIIDAEVRTIKVPVQCDLAPCPEIEMDQIIVDGYVIPSTMVQRYGNEVVESITGKQISSKTIKKVLYTIAIITILYLIFKPTK